MSALAKATLQELQGDRSPTPAGQPIEVQFNPSSLRMQMTNNVEGGKTTTRAVEQHTGTSSDTLSLELVFDTADEGTTQAPRSVRVRTAEVSKFVRPKQGGKQTPPRVRFHWGDFLFEGVMTSYSEDLDLFASTGVPLRAKVQVSILGQDTKYESLATGPGAATGAGATPPGGARGGPAGPLDRIATALGGESAPALAARLGLDPSGWRGLQFGGASPLSLGAGLEVGFSASLSAGAGLGVHFGVEAELGLSLEAKLGLAPGAVPAAGQGAALASAGGVTAAVETVRIDQSRTAVAKALQAFGATDATGVAESTAVGTVGASPPRPAPLRAEGDASAAVRRTASPAPAPRHADARTLSFGRGVPLRTQFTGAAETHVTVVGARPPATEVPITRDPTVSPWTLLPAAHEGRAAADALQQQRRPAHPCGCGHGTPGRGDGGCGWVGHG